MMLYRNIKLMSAFGLTGLLVSLFYAAIFSQQKDYLILFTEISPIFIIIGFFVGFIFCVLFKRKNSKINIMHVVIIGFSSGFLIVIINWLVSDPILSSVSFKVIFDVFSWSIAVGIFLTLTGSLVYFLGKLLRLN